MLLWQSDWYIASCLFRNHAQVTKDLRTVSSGEYMCPTIVGSRHGWSLYTIVCDDNYSKLIIMSHSGKSKCDNNSRKSVVLLKPLYMPQWRHLTIKSCNQGHFEFFTSFHISSPHRFEKGKVEFVWQYPICWIHSRTRLTMEGKSVVPMLMALCCIQKKIHFR